MVSRLGDAAGALVSIGAGLVSSIFALITILVISIFMVGRGRAWRDAILQYRPPHQAKRMRRATDKIADAVGSYVGGALAQATVAGVAAWIMLTILGVPLAPRAGARHRAARPSSRWWAPPSGRWWWAW